MGNKQIISTLLEEQCMISAFKNSKIGDYTFRMKCIKDTKYALVCTEQEQEIMNIPLYSSVSIDLYSQKNDPIVFKTSLMEITFKNIKSIIKRENISELDKLEQDMYVNCSFYR